VSRLEPENQADVLLRAYRAVPGDVPLLIVGDAPYADAYKAEITRLAGLDPRVRLLGGRYGEAYRDLQRAALAYVQATSVGGTHPALIEAMAAGNLVLAYDAPENREVTAGSAVLWRTEEALAAALAEVINAPDDPEHARLRVAARSRAAGTYSWAAIADAYETLFGELASGRD
jgi:glycosyltransferase involved in cell wall biosynthesis